MAASLAISERPAVTVVVPARNEEACLGACLQSLVTQRDVSFEVIVVDDGSTDHTREIASSFPSVKVIGAGELPPGWTGKNNAMAAGARHARGNWLLFTDADTIHLPASLAGSVREAQERRAALLSYSPRQEVRGFWEKAVMPVIFAELAMTYRPSRVSDPASPIAAANGQYLLISRDAYEAVGGHAAVAASLLEDVALARIVKASGRRIFFRYGGDAVRTRMYRSFSQLCEGWSKNLALLFPHAGWLAARRLGEFLLIAASAAVAVFGLTYDLDEVAGLALALCAIAYAFFLARIRKAHFAWDATALALLGLPLFSFLLLRSQISYARGKVSWKGRIYGSATRDLGPRPAPAKVA